MSGQCVYNENSQFRRTEWALPDFTRKLAGMTQDGSGLWFEPRLGGAPEVQYWADQRLVRTDKAV